MTAPASACSGWNGRPACCFGRPRPNKLFQHRDRSKSSRTRDAFSNRRGACSTQHLRTFAVSAEAAHFKKDAERLTHDLRHRGLIQSALKKYEVARDAKKANYQDWQSARQT